MTGTIDDSSTDSGEKPGAVTATGFVGIPSVDRLLHSVECEPLLESYGRARVTQAARSILAEIRAAIANQEESVPPDRDIISRMHTFMAARSFSLQPLLNLTGTVLHTNLGRAALPETAITTMVRIARGSSNLEFDLASGKRGDRDVHIERLIVEMTGAEAATVVNNNAAAVLITLATLARNREVPVSRGELVEIGGSFRIPEIMLQSGCRLVEIGSTNRTHLRDYAAAINKDTALLMKVHTSNYEIKGFTNAVKDSEVSALAHEHGLPFVTDLGSGTLVDLTNYNLPHEPTAREAIEGGADVVTFSGDKLLGGPQAGIIIGRRDLIEQIRGNPLKRALRVDKITMAALFEVLNLYRDPDRLQETLPTLKFLTRSAAEIQQLAEQVLPAFQQALNNHASVTIIDALSQIGSGSLPLDLLASKAIRIVPLQTEHADKALQEIALRFRQLPVPIVGRLHQGALLFDLRTLDSVTPLLEQLEILAQP